MQYRNIIFAILANAAAAASANAATIDFGDLGTFTAPSLVFEGGIVIGSGDINVLASNSLGIVGGTSDITIDTTEFIQFSFAAPVTDVSYFVDICGFSGGLCGGRTVEVFGSNGGSLGVFLQDFPGFYFLSDLVGAALISGFTLSAIDRGDFRIERLSFESVQEVPLPAALPLFLAGMAGLKFARRRRRT